MAVFDSSSGTRDYELVVCVRVQAWSDWYCCDSEFFLVALGVGVVTLRAFWWVPLDLEWFLHRSFFWSLGIHQALCCFWGHDLVFTYFSPFNRLDRLINLDSNNCPLL